MAGQVANREWSSRWGFMLAAVGVAIGLGNLWRFPFIAGENGGGAFVLIYIIFVAVISFPIMAGELVIGKLGGASAVESMRRLTSDLQVSKFWSSIGWMSVLAPFVGLSYYAIVAGWSFYYIYAGASGQFSGLTAETSGALFGEFQNRIGLMSLVHFTFIAITVWIVGRGIKGGIEWATKLMMPLLFILLMILVVYGAFTEGFGRAVDFLFYPDFSQLNSKGVLMAMGQAFFSVAIGVGAMITYGAYLKSKTSLPRAAAFICTADTVVAVLAGLAIFPIVFSAGLSPAEGPELIFVTLPIGFGEMPGGQIIGPLFFILLFFAALTSSIGMLEPVVSWLEEKLTDMPRLGVAAIAGGAAGVLGLPSLFSFNILNDVRPMALIDGLADKSIFGTVDFAVSSIILPLNALLITLFAGWILKSKLTREILTFRKEGGYRYWQIIVRYLAPIAILIVLIDAVTG